MIIITETIQKNGKRNKKQKTHTQKKSWNYKKRHKTTNNANNNNTTHQIRNWTNKKNDTHTKQSKQIQENMF